MRKILVTLLLGGLLLSGCGSGADLEEVTVGGPQDRPTVSVQTPFEVGQTSRRLLTTGDGPALEKGDRTLVHYLGVNGRTGEVFDSSFGKEPVEFALQDGRLVPGFITGLAGAPVGSRVLIAMPPEDGYPEGIPDGTIEPGDSLLFLVDVLATRRVRERAEGTEVPAVPGNPVVTLDEEGVPGVEVPPGPPPAQPVIQPLIQGDGPEIRAGQQAVVQFLSVRWSDGEVVDSSWAAGRPGRLQVGTGDLVPALDAALLGERIGSRVLVVTPVPEAPAPGQETTPAPSPAPAEPGDQTFVFVIDILDA